MNPPSNRPWSSALAELRATITIDRLRHEMETILIERDRAADAIASGAPVLAQIRISQADTRYQETSGSPARQLRRIAEYCVEYGFYPVDLCFEAQSGHLTDSKPRALFARFREQVASGELEIDAVVTYTIDRFTRDRLIGEQWLKTLKDKRVDLHEAELLRDPRPLREKEGEYADKFLRAWEESRRISDRVRAGRREHARGGGLLIRLGYGHEPITRREGTRDKHVGARVVPHEAEVIREATRRLHTGEPLSRIASDLNDRGLRGRRGGRWTTQTLRGALVAARLAGVQLCEGEYLEAPIEAILTRDEWEENIRRTRPRVGTPHATYLLSGLGRCAKCDDPITASKHKDKLYYRCGRFNRRTRTCNCGRPGGECVCPRAARREGLHGSRRGEAVEEFLLEIALAAHDHERVLTESHAHRAELDERDDREERLRRQIAQLDAERRDVARQERQGYLTAAEAGEEVQVLLDRTAVIRAEQDRFARQRHARHQFADVSSASLRQQIEDGGTHVARQLIERVIDHFVLTATSDNPGNPYGGIDVVFADGYQPPAEAVEALRHELCQRHQRASRLQDRARKATAEDETIALSFWEGGMNNADIARKFNELARPTATGRGHWYTQTIREVVMRACERRGIDYKPNPTVYSRYPAEVRATVYELFRERGLTFAEIIDVLDERGIRPWQGDAWNGKRLRACYASECARRGETTLGRRPQLSPELRRRIRLMSRADGKGYREIARWLNQSGIPRWKNLPWDDKAVGHIIRSEEARLRGNQA